jgi:acyl carrier protein
MDIIGKLQDIMRFTFLNPDLVIGRDTTALDVDGWDSLSHTLLMLEIEQAFSVEIDPQKAIQLSNVGELMDYIQSLMA